MSSIAFDFKRLARPKGAYVVTKPMSKAGQKSRETANHIEPNNSDLITISELSCRLGISKKAIRRKMEKGILIRGTHWFRPPGFRTIFSWCAIEETIQHKTTSQNNSPSQPKDAFDGLHNQ